MKTLIKTQKHSNNSKSTIHSYWYRDGFPNNTVYVFFNAYWLCEVVNNSVFPIQKPIATDLYYIIFNTKNAKDYIWT